MSAALKLGYDPVALCCGTCGLEFSVPRAFYELKKADSTVWRCPNGHERYFPRGKSREELLREELDRTERNLKFEKRQRRLAEKQAQSFKGQVTKIKNRVGKGVCPCCNRSFVNLQRHMHTQHPDFVTKE